MYHPASVVPAATIRAMPGDLEPLPHPPSRPRPARAELPVLGERGEREQGRLHLDALMAKLAAAYQP